MNDNLRRITGDDHFDHFINGVSPPRNRALDAVAWVAVVFGLIIYDIVNRGRRDAEW